MIGGDRLVKAAVLARTMAPKDLAWQVYCYIEARHDLDPILETAAAVCLALQKGTNVKPSIGRIVHYCLAREDAAEINRRRVARPHDAGWPAGAQAHVGNPVEEGRVFPCIVTMVWGDGNLINGQVLLDGNDSLWVTSRLAAGVEGSPASPSPGFWHWPARVD